MVDAILEILPGSIATRCSAQGREACYLAFLLSLFGISFHKIEEVCGGTCRKT